MYHDTGADIFDRKGERIMERLRAENARLRAACEAVVTQGLGEMNAPDDPVVVIQLTRDEWNALRAALGGKDGAE